MTNKKSLEILRRKFGFEGPTNLFFKLASKSLIGSGTSQRFPSTAQSRRHGYSESLDHVTSIG